MNDIIILLEGIERHFKIGAETIKALRGVDLKIYKNEYVALMGPSGSGKSTLMDDNELAEIRNKQIGFVFQTFNLLPRSTSLDNVILPLIYSGIKKEERIKKATKALDDVGLLNRITHKPNELSGGQRQRVAIARALVNNPSIILADEPTGNLDSKTSVEIMGLFDAIHQKGNTVIIVTHEEDIAKYAHRIIRLRDGVVESDEINKEPRTV